MPAVTRIRDTERDTAKARSRTTRSGEFQARVDAAKKAKAEAKAGANSSDTQKSTKPTAEQARKARLDKNRNKSTQRDTDRANSRVTRSREYQRRIDKMSEVEQVGTPQGNVDFVSSSTTASSGGASSALSGIEIIWADQTETFIPASDFFTDYDPDSPTSDLYWSVVFAVSSNAFTQADPTYDEVQELWDDVGTAQTVYRLRLITQNKVPTPDINVPISVYGQYHEELRCVDGDLVTVLIKAT